MAAKHADRHKATKQGGYGRCACYICFKYSRFLRGTAVAAKRHITITSGEPAAIVPDLGKSTDAGTCCTCFSCARKAMQTQ